MNTKLMAGIGAVLAALATGAQARWMNDGSGGPSAADFAQEQRALAADSQAHAAQQRAAEAQARAEAAAQARAAEAEARAAAQERAAAQARAANELARAEAAAQARAAEAQARAANERATAEAHARAEAARAEHANREPAMGKAADFVLQQTVKKASEYGLGKVVPGLAPKKLANDEEQTKHQQQAIEENLKKCGKPTSCG